MNIIFCDFNKSLCQKVFDLQLPDLAVAYGDIFRFKGVIVSASNPQFTMGGGLDAIIAQKYPHETKIKQKLGGGNERLGEVIFTITVNDHLEATPELVREALRFALDNVYADETLLLTGLGTGIGGMDEDKFIQLLKEAIYERSN